MTTLRHHSILAVVLLLTFAPAINLAAAESSEKISHAPGDAKAQGVLLAVTANDAEWLKRAKDQYPMTECVVSGEKLPTAADEMFDFIYRVKEKPDRLISFCCEGCSKDFLLDPVTFIRKLDEASAARK